MSRNFQILPGNIQLPQNWLRARAQLIKSSKLLIFYLKTKAFSYVQWRSWVTQLHLWKKKKKKKDISTIQILRNAFVIILRSQEKKKISRKKEATGMAKYLCTRAGKSNFLQTCGFRICCVCLWCIFLKPFFFSSVNSSSRDNLFSFMFPPWAMHFED